MKLQETQPNCTINFGQIALLILAKSDHFNQRFQADIFWIKDDNKKFVVLLCVDSATKYQTATLVPDEKTSNLIIDLEKYWIAHFGPPETLLTDEGKG